jgi:DNA-binding NarL/FixJ family response regulator
VVLDLDLPGLNWIEATPRIVAESSVAVVVLSRWPRHDLVTPALRAGGVSVALEDVERTELFEGLRFGAPTHKENPVLTPNVIEIRRGSAHCKAGARSSPMPGHDADVRLVRFGTQRQRVAPAPAISIRRRAAT